MIAQNQFKMDELFELLKKLSVASEDPETRKELEKFGIKPETIKGIEKPKSFEELLKNFDYQSTFDKKIEKALETREKKLREKWNLDEDGKPKGSNSDEEEDEDDLSDIKDPALKKALQTVKDLGNRLKQVEESKIQETEKEKRENAIKKLKEKGITSVYVSELDLSKPIEDQLDTVKEKFDADNQEFLRNKYPGIKLPKTSKVDDNTPDPTEVENLKKLM